ncbi:MAG TPA: hypothetical protein VFQ53_36030 [Kofleriaceae bacterium]|nr:hypothetical protein [Kofleriaceae bacterium]
MRALSIVLLAAACGSVQEAGICAFETREGATVRELSIGTCDGANQHAFEYGSNGELRQMRTVIDGRLEVAMLAWNRDGTLDAITEVHGDRLQGQLTVYDGQGRAEARVGMNGGFEGPSRTLWPSGRVRSERWYVHGQLDGPTREWSEDGALLLEGQNERGQMVGTWIRYFPGGQIRQIDRFGVSKGFTPNLQFRIVRCAADQPLLDIVKSGEAVRAHPCP